jgi:NTE family protein
MTEAPARKRTRAAKPALPAVVPKRKTLAIALGGGGARGLAHIPVLEAIEESGFEIAGIAGTSMGALVGACVASGLSARTLRAYATGIFRDRGQVFSKVLSARLGRWTDIFALDFASPITLDPVKLFGEFLPGEVKQTFEELSIPFAAVATDFHARREVLFTAGPLLPAIAASAAVPGLFRPVVLGERVHIDGAAVDPNPVSALPVKADYRMVIDVLGNPPGKPPAVPAGIESLFAAAQIMQSVIADLKAAPDPPDLTIRPNVTAFGVFDFLKVVSVFRAADQVKAETRAKLAALART